MYLASAGVLGAPECVCKSGCSYSRGELRPSLSESIQDQQSQTHSLDSNLVISMFVRQNVLFSGNSAPQTVLHVNQAYLSFVVVCASLFCKSAPIECTCTTAHCVRGPTYPYAVVCQTHQLCVREVQDPIVLLWVIH